MTRWFTSLIRRILGREKSMKDEIFTARKKGNESHIDWHIILFTFIIGAGISRYIKFMTDTFIAPDEKPGTIVAALFSRNFTFIHEHSLWAAIIGNIFVYLFGAITVVLPFYLFRKLKPYVPDNTWGYLVIILIGAAPFGLIYLASFILTGIKPGGIFWVDDNKFLISMFGLYVVIVAIAYFLTRTVFKNKNLDC